MAYSGRRFDLRNRTQTAHENLDAAVGAFDTLADYRRYVSRLASFRFAMDKALHDATWPGDWHWRPTYVADCLAADVKDLGLPQPPFETPAINLSGPSRLMGALYVLEGSTLGARVLRQRAAALGLDETFGARHLAHMSNDIARWQSFLVLLDTARDFDLDLAVDSANAVFAFALRCFESEFLVVH